MNRLLVTALFSICCPPTAVAVAIMVYWLRVAPLDDHHDPYAGGPYD